jgi:hypothetical protein
MQLDIGGYSMNAIASFLRQIQVRKILGVFIAGVALILATACSADGAKSANPHQRDNVPLQTGANNTPYTRGSDSKGEFIPSSDYGNRAHSQQHSDASGLFSNNQLIASSVAGSRSSDMLYQSSDQREVGFDDRKPAQKQATEPEKIPAESQPSLDRSNPDEKILENVGKQFREASKFLNEDTRSSAEYAKAKTKIGANQAPAQ